jgi:hypothetical protein
MEPRYKISQNVDGIISNQQDIHHTPHRPLHQRHIHGLKNIQMKLFNLRAIASDIEREFPTDQPEVLKVPFLGIDFYS